MYTESIFWVLKLQLSLTDKTLHQNIFWKIMSLLPVIHNSADRRQLSKIWRELAQHYFPPDSFWGGWCRQTGGYLNFFRSWLHIIFCRILFEGADADSWWFYLKYGGNWLHRFFLRGLMQTERIHQNIMQRQFPPNLKKNRPQNSVEAVPAKSQKESAPKFCGGSSRHILKRMM